MCPSLEQQCSPPAVQASNLGLGSPLLFYTIPVSSWNPVNATVKVTSESGKVSLLFYSHPPPGYHPVSWVAETKPTQTELPAYTLASPVCSWRRAGLVTVDRGAPLFSRTAADGPRQPASDRTSHPTPKPLGACAGCSQYSGETNSPELLSAEDRQRCRGAPSICGLREDTWRVSGASQVERG